MDEQLYQIVVKQIEEYKVSISKAFKRDINEVVDIIVKRHEKHVEPEPIVKQIVRKPPVKQIVKVPEPEPEPEPEEYEEEYEEEAEEEVEEYEEEPEESYEEPEPPKPEPIKNNNFRNLQGSAMQQLRNKGNILQRAPPAPVPAPKKAIGRNLKAPPVKEAAAPVAKVEPEKVYRGDMSKYRHQFRALCRDKFKEELKIEGLVYKPGIYESLVGYYWKNQNNDKKKKLVEDGVPISMRQYWKSLSDGERNAIKSRYPGCEINIWN